uniref:Uncharacterized protein n=1 Tax=Aegilops tauschii TaxID=37682 RepID=M8C9B4_AEGTA
MAWALFNAFVFVVSYAMGYAIDYALHYYHVSCSQAAAAALVLWLPGRRRWVLRALPCLALVLTVVGHCMFFADVCLNLAADPGRLVCWIVCTMAIVFYAVGDIISFLTLLQGGEE